MKPVSVEVRLRESDLLVGGRTDPSRGGNKATARDAGGRLTIPASALRGALRTELERLLRARDGAACGANRAPEEERSCDCPVCRLFGSEGSATGALRLEDAVLVGAEVPTRLRPQVAVSRSTGSAVAAHLAFSEPGSVAAASEDKEPVFRARGCLVPLGPTDEDRERLETDFENLAAACQAVSGIGGGRSRGLGWVKCSLHKARAPEPQAPNVVDAAARATCLRVELVAEAPVHLGAGRPLGYFHRTLRHVPASTVRGALAFALLDGGLVQAEEPGFQDLFGEAASAAFTSARPDAKQPCATRRKCRPGEHVFDDLAGELLRRTASARGVALAAVDRELCPVPDCAATKVVPAPAPPVEEDLDIRVRTRTALNRRTGTSMDAKLFSMEVVEPTLAGGREPVRFVAEVHDLTSAAAAALARLDGRPAWIGGKRSQGFGRCRLRVREAPADQVDELRAAVESLDRELRTAWAALRSAAALAEDLLPAERILLPLVLTEPWMPEEQTSQEAVTGPLPWSLRHRFLLGAAVGSFGAIEAKRYGAPSSVAGGEVAAVAAAAAGSVFVYEVGRAELANRLAEILAGPVAGSERALSRGRLRVWTPDLSK